MSTINQLASKAFSSQKRVSKSDIQASIVSLAENVESGTKEFDVLADLYKYFMPTTPSKPKTGAQWVLKCLPKNDLRYYLNRFEVSNGELIACDGHRLMICKTDLPDGAYDRAFNLLSEDAAGKYPDWRRVLPRTFESRSIVLGELDISNRSVEKKVDVCDIVFSDTVTVRVNSKFLDEAMYGFTENAVVYYGETSIDSLLFLENDRKAVIMPIRV